jgi:HEPN domain-containing protein
MGRRYIEEARGRVELVRLASERSLWATVVREAQECVELFLKGALRLGAVEEPKGSERIVGSTARR